MKQLTRRATALSAFALMLTLAPATGANAGDHPKPKSKPAAAAKGPKPPMPKNTMVVCNHSGYMIGVYAMGAGDVRRTDLAGNFDECVKWKRMSPGFKDVGFNWRVPSQQNVLLEMRVKYDGYTVYKTLPPGGSTLLQMGGDKTMKIDYYTPRG